MADAAITQSGADDWPRQPSAGGTPHSPFRSISVMNLSSSALYSCGGGFAVFTSFFQLLFHSTLHIQFHFLSILSDSIPISSRLYSFISLQFKLDSNISSPAIFYFYCLSPPSPHSIIPLSHFLSLTHFLLLFFSPLSFSISISHYPLLNSSFSSSLSLMNNTTVSEMQSYSYRRDSRLLVMEHQLHDL